MNSRRRSLVSRDIVGMVMVGVSGVLGGPRGRDHSVLGAWKYHCFPALDFPVRCWIMRTACGCYFCFPARSPGSSFSYHPFLLASAISSLGYCGQWKKLSRSLCLWLVTDKVKRRDYSSTIRNSWLRPLRGCRMRTISFCDICSSCL